MAAAPPTTTATSTTSESPVVSVITKRLRALRKKLNRITQMEESVSNGKTLNNEQLEVLRSKPAVVTLIDEIDKLRAPLAAAAEEEVSLALSSSRQPDRVEDSSVGVEHVAGIEDLSKPIENFEKTDNVKIDGCSDVVRDLVKLLYFGSLFDVKPQSDFTSLMLTRTHERGCCLTYDYVTDDATDLLGERDLDLISALQGLIIARPVHSTLSHQNALELCFEHAKLWLDNVEQPIDSQSNVTYAALREKLNKIMSSDYFTATPQMKGPGEVAAAAAVGNFGLFQVPTQESMVNVEVPVQMEGSPEQCYETEENAANHVEYETTGHQSANGEEFHKDNLEPEIHPEVISEQTDQEQSQNVVRDDGYVNVGYKDQQYVHRRGQRGSRGGDRRGYPNGRGGRGTGRGNGPYQNGRNQYYDNYYPRNNYYQRRGGRGGAGGGGGGGGGGGEYNNNSSAPDAGVTS